LNGNKVTVATAEKIEQSTRLQSKCSKWFTERKFRLTASHFGEICKITERRDLKKFCETLFDPPALNTPAVNHGKTSEHVAVLAFEDKYGSKVSKCGLFVNENFPNLAASPDDLIDKETIIEVKCPFLARNEVIGENDNVDFLEMNSEGSLELKKSHNYFFQIQGQLGISKAHSCILIIYTYKDLKIVQVPFDEDFFFQSYYQHCKPFMKKSTSHFSQQSCKFVSFQNI